MPSKSKSTRIRDRSTIQKPTTTASSVMALLRYQASGSLRNYFVVRTMAHRSDFLISNVARASTLELISQALQPAEFDIHWGCRGDHDFAEAVWRNSRLLSRPRRPGHQQVLHVLFRHQNTYSSCNQYKSPETETVQHRSKSCRPKRVHSATRTTGRKRLCRTLTVRRLCRCLQFLQHLLRLKGREGAG